MADCGQFGKPASFDSKPSTVPPTGFGSGASGATWPERIAVCHYPSAKHRAGGLHELTLSDPPRGWKHRPDVHRIGFDHRIRVVVRSVARRRDCREVTRLRRALAGLIADA